MRVLLGITAVSLRSIYEHCVAAFGFTKDGMSLEPQHCEHAVQLAIKLYEHKSIGKSVRPTT